MCEPSTRAPRLLHRRVMRIGPTATTLAVFLAALCAWPTHAQPLAMRSPLSDAERAQLDRGSIVLRRVRERRGPLTLIGGTSFQVVDLPPSAVWRALHDDPDHIRRMLPQVHSARQLREEANLRVMHFEHRVGVAQREVSAAARAGAGGWHGPGGPGRVGVARVVGRDARPLRSGGEAAERSVPERAEPQVLPVDTVVLCAGQVSERGLADALAERGRTVHVIGGADVAAELDAKRAIDQGTRVAARI